MRLTLLVLGTGFLGVIFHESVYRRTIEPGEGDYDLSGLITHAGVDMILLTLGISLMVWLVTSSFLDRIRAIFREDRRE